MDQDSRFWRVGARAEVYLSSQDMLLEALRNEIIDANMKPTERKGNERWIASSFTSKLILAVLTVRHWPQQYTTKMKALSIATHVINELRLPLREWDDLVRLSPCRRTAELRRALTSSAKYLFCLYSQSITPHTTFRTCSGAYHRGVVPHLMVQALPHPVTSQWHPPNRVTSSGQPSTPLLNTAHSLPQPPQHQATPSQVPPKRVTCCRTSRHGLCAPHCLHQSPQLQFTLIPMHLEHVSDVAKAAVRGHAGTVFVVTRPD